MSNPPAGLAQNRVKLVRETLGLSKAEVCRRAPVSKRELALIERGHEPKLTIARRLVRLFNAHSIETLFPDPRDGANE